PIPKRPAQKPTTEPSNTQVRKILNNIINCFLN
ncbi:MAG: hypothetical protein ACJAXS_002094, partial [Colwellia sp.]